MLRLFLESKLNEKNRLTAINAWAVVYSDMDQEYYSGNRVDRKSRTIMTMYGALHMIRDVDRLCLKRKGVRGLTSVECCVREEENSLGFYVAKSEENLIKGVAAAEIINTEDIVISGEFKKQ